MDFIQYFPELTEAQKTQFEALQSLYAEWNAKINVISRKDIDQLYEHHVQHSLAIASFIQSKWGTLPAGTTLMDVGTGGGFPGVPLAIFYPECHFLLVDRIGKKVRVAQEVASAIGLQNVEFRHAGVEEIKTQFDYVVSRAVMNLPDLVKLVQKNMTKGLICLKGGDLTEELAPKSCKKAQVIDISTYFHEPFFETKKLVYVPV